MVGFSGPFSGKNGLAGLTPLLQNVTGIDRGGKEKRRLDGKVREMKGEGCVQ